MRDEHDSLEERCRLSRRGFLVLGAAALARARRRTRRGLAGGRRGGGEGIVKPLPPEWFVDHGTNAETRWEALRDVGFRVPNARFFGATTPRRP